MALAWKFGASGIVDAYRVIVLLLTYGQQLFISFILPFVIVPVFAEYRTQGKEQEAWVLADSVGRLLLLFGILIAALLFLRPDWVVRAVVPGLADEARMPALFFVRWCGVAFIPICWTGAACGILYAHNIFTVNAIAQLSANVVLLLAILAGGTKLGASSLAIGILGGTLASTIIYRVSVARVRRKYSSAGPSGSLDFRSIYKAFRIAAPLLGSIIAGQSTSVVVTRSLSRLPAGTIAAYGYAYKMSGIVQLVPNALGTVLFPKFSMAWYGKGEQEFVAACTKALRAAMFTAIPLTCVAYVLRRPLLMLLLHRGAFSISDVSSSSVLFGLLILGVPAGFVGGYVDRMFYSLQETRLPVLMDIIGNGFELAFIPFLASKLGAKGVAIAYMLLPWIIGAGLLGLIKRKIRRFPLRDLGVFGLWISLMSAGSVLAGASLGHICAGLAHIGPVPSALIEIAVGGSVSLMLYGWVNVLLGFDEATRSRDFIRQAIRTSLQKLSGVLPTANER